MFVGIFLFKIVFILSSDFLVCLVVCGKGVCLRVCLVKYSIYVKKSMIQNMYM